MFLIYSRRSTDDADNQKNSLEYQESECRRYAKDNNLRLSDNSIDGIVESGIIKERHSAFKSSALTVSGAGLVEYQIERPKFMQMISWLLEKKYEGVIVLCWDRISRNEQSDLIVKELIDKHNIPFRFVQAEYDHGTSSGALHRDIDGMFARHHSRVTSEKVRATFTKLRAEKKCTYTAPIGYLDEGSDNKVFDPVRAPVIKRMFELYATGEYSTIDMTKWAIDQGLTSKPRRRRRTKDEKMSGTVVEAKGSIPLSESTVQFLLTNPFYIGKLKYKETLIDGMHPPLIDIATFERVQEILKGNRVSAHYIQKNFFAYRDFFRCTCGRKYTPYRASKNGEVYYTCKCKNGCDNIQKTLHERHLEEIIQTIMNKIHFTEEELEEIEAGQASGLSKAAEKRDKDQLDLNRRRAKIQGDIKFLNERKIDLLREGMNYGDWQKDYDAKIQKLEELDEEQKAYTATEKEMLDYILTFSELTKGATASFKYGTDTEKRTLARKVFSELIVKDGVLTSYKAKDNYAILIERASTSQYQVNGSAYWTRFERTEFTKEQVEAYCRYVLILNNIALRKKISI